MTSAAVTERRCDARPAGRRRAGLSALLCAHAVSAAGASMTVVAVPWLVLQTTGSVARTGAVVAVYAVGAGVAGFLAGPFVDRLGFKPVGVLAYAVGAAAMGAVALLYTAGALSFGLLLALVLVAAAFSAPGAVALSGLVPHLARAAGTPLERANSAFRAISNLTQLLGPALGGMAALLIGAHNVLLLDAAAGTLAALLVWSFIQPPAGWRHRATATTGYLAELREGLATIRRIRLLTGVATIRAAYNLLDGGLAGIVLVSIAYQWWGDPASFGAMLTAFGAGALTGTVCYGTFGHRLPRRPIFLGIAVLVSLPVAAIALAPSLTAVMATLAVLGVIAAPSGPLTASAVQQVVPRPVYGRVASTIRVIATATTPIGIALAAGAVAVFGLRPTILAMAGGYLLIGLACWRAPAFHDLDTARRDAEDPAVRDQRGLL
jgi:MFS family permease